MTKFNRTCFLLWRFSVFGILISIPGNLVGQDENTYLVETTQTAPLQIFESGTLQTLAKIPAGTDLKVLRERKGWYLVIDPATGHKGWIDGEFTTRNSDSSKKSRDPITIDSYPSNLFITNQNDVPVFVGKELIGKIEKHKIVWVFGLKDKWFYVKLPGSAKRGWVESKYLAVRRMEPKIRRQQEAAAEKAAIEVRNLSRDKKYLEALAKAKESVNLHIPLHGEEHPITIRENVAVGWLMIKTGQRQAGREHLSRWIEVEEGLQGVDSPGLITTYRLAGRFALDVSDEFAGVFYDKIFRVIDKQHASDLQQRTHKRREEVVQLHQARATQLALKYALKNLAKIKSTNFRGTDLEALELTNIGAFSQSLNQLDSAEEYFLRALAIPADKMSDQLRGNIHSRLGELYQQQRRHKNADQNFGLAAKYIQTGYGENHALTANALFEHGWNKYYLTDYQGAVEQLTKSLATYHKVSPPQPMKMAKVHVQLGYVYTMSGSASKAVSQFRRGVEMVEAAGYKDKVEASSYYQGLGFGLDVIGDPEAEKYLKKSVLLHEKSNSPPSRSKAESLRRYASFLLYRGQYDRAERYFLKATEITSKFPSLESYDAMNLHALASIAEHRKNYPRATRLANQALGKLLATHASDHQSVLQIRYRLANLQLLQGDIAAAERAYSKLAPLAKEKLGPHPHTIQTYTQWAKASTGASQLKRLSESRKLAFQYVNNELPLLPPYQQIGFLNQRYKTEFYDAIGLALTTNVDAVRVNESFEWLINGKAVSHESLGRYYRQVSGKSRPKAVPWRRRGELQNRIAPNLAYIDILKVRLSRNGSHQKATHYVAYVLTADELKFVDLGLANFIDDQVVRARETVVETATAIAAEGEQEATNKCNDVLSILSRELWNKLDIGPNISKLTISPDSNLWLLPWSALPLDANGRTLIEGYDINFVVTGRDLFAESEGKPADPSAIIADPNFGRVSSTGDNRSTIRNSAQQLNASRFRQFAPVKQLLFAGFEASNIAQLLKQIDNREPMVFVKDNATEANVKKVKSPRHLLLTTHGLFLGDTTNSNENDFSSIELRGVANDEIANLTSLRQRNPLENAGLLFSGFNRNLRGTDDSVLTGREIVEMELEGTQLVVLSACDTAVGEVNNGEGVAGLRQAFQLAGAQNVLATLWSVDDEQTARTMVNFYKNLALNENHGYSQVLRHCLVTRIKERRLRHGAAHPFYWAAFTLTGIN